MNLRKRIERLEARKPPGPSALVILTEAPTPEAPAVERQESFIINRVGTDANLDDYVVPLDILFPPGTKREREDYLRRAMKIYVNVNPLDL